jgi:hypothetical protein
LIAEQEIYGNLQTWQVPRAFGSEGKAFSMNGD